MRVHSHTSNFIDYGKQHHHCHLNDDLLISVGCNQKIVVNSFFYVCFYFSFAGRIFFFVGTFPSIMRLHYLLKSVRIEISVCLPLQLMILIWIFEFICGNLSHSQWDFYVMSRLLINMSDNIYNLVWSNPFN